MPVTGTPVAHVLFVLVVVLLFVPTVVLISE